MVHFLKKDQRKTRNKSNVTQDQDNQHQITNTEQLKTDQQFEEICFGAGKISKIEKSEQSSSQYLRISNLEKQSKETNQTLLFMLNTIIKFGELVDGIKLDI